MNNPLKEKLDIADEFKGCRINIKARPGASRDGVAGLHDGALKISLTAAPEKGKANKALAKFLARFFGVSASSVELLSGQTSTRKVFYLPLQSQKVMEILHQKEPDL